MAKAHKHTLAEYRIAAETLWGAAGAYAADEFARLNREHFDGEIHPTPIVIGITAFGRCLGLTRPTGHVVKPRITLASNIFCVTQHGAEMGTAPICGSAMVTDTLLHEMIHVLLIQRGEDPSHNGNPWCAELERLSPVILGHPIKAAPVKSVRVNGSVRKQVPDGCIPRAALASWPQSLRPAGFDWGQPIPVDSY
jgi:hypothetical protein